MVLRNGRAYIFVRWSGSAAAPARVGEVGWALEFIDRQGRFFCFHCGAIEAAAGGARSAWQERCNTLPELIQAMSHTQRPGFDEVKSFEVEEADPETAMQVAQRASEDLIPRMDSLELVREILTRYGVRGLPNSRGYSAPFLWYNILPGRSVPLRKLPVHLFQVRAQQEGARTITSVEVEDLARQTAQGFPDCRSVGECFVGKNKNGFFVGLCIAINPLSSLRDGHELAEKIEEAVRAANSRIRYVLVRVQPYEEAG